MALTNRKNINMQSLAVVACLDGTNLLFEWLSLYFPVGKAGCAF
jgi:hypothetical protein